MRAVKKQVVFLLFFQPPPTTISIKKIILYNTPFLDNALSPQNENVIILTIKMQILCRL